MAKKMQTMDGNTAVAHSSYAFTEVAAIYPITPSTTMAEITEDWASKGRKNIFGETVKLIELQSEGGAAGAMHGSLQVGSLSSTYTASQGLLLMIPNMYKLAGELLPGVYHVSARTIAGHALSIFGDHSDVYSALHTGCVMLASNSVQEAMDLSAVAHLSAIRARLPFIHFFDGFRTSHEIQKIEVLDYADLAKLVDHDAIDAFRARALNPEHPVTKGTAQNPDVFFQNKEALNKFYTAVPAIIEEEMAKINKLTGRDYKLFNYHGAADAERMIVAMGSLTETIRETVDYLNAKGEKVGAVAVHLFRPFSAKHFLDVVPKTVKKIAVIDRAKEFGAQGEPLFMDIQHIYATCPNAPLVIGGRAGISSKDTLPADIIAAFKNLNGPEVKKDFTLAIIDDVTFKSLPREEMVDTVPEGTIECKFYGLGSDGTVGANKNSIKIIGDKSPLYAQGYFAYDSKKSGGITISHLRFGKQPISSTYLVSSPSFVSCSTQAYLNQYDMLAGIKQGGTFLLNTIWDKNEVVAHLPNHVKRTLAVKNVKMYVINATKIALDLGLGNRTNTILQAAFFKLANVIDYSAAVEHMKGAIKKSYGSKGDDIVNMNNAAVDKGADGLELVTIDPAWSTLSAEKVLGTAKHDGIEDEALQIFVDKILTSVNAQEGDTLKVSDFVGAEDGVIPCGSAAYEKRGIAVKVPEWQIDKCIQCNQCSYVCPHAVIRPYLIDESEKAAIGNMATKKAIGPGLEGLEYRIQPSVLDCTGCGSCAQVCPVKALDMKMLETQTQEQANYDLLHAKVTYKADRMSTATVKGSQFAQPLFEFSGACGGCGETPYYKLLTQLFGDRMIIANATGCSSIYCGSYPATPLCKNADGHGPAWANSLFEDNAEFGLGMVVAIDKARNTIKNKMAECKDKVSAETAALFAEWSEKMYDAESTKALAPKLVAALETESSCEAKYILKFKDQFVKKSIWSIGGDGWSYDIGFGGVDHSLASGEDLNILVMDTEIYSNTGGQASKSTPTGAVAKFYSSGKPSRKKDLGKMMMSYGYVYVAQVAMGANQAQYLKAVKEAESYPGPSLVIAYAPCINHGIKGGMTVSQMQEKKAVESGYWTLYRFDPRLEAQGKNPFQLDSKEPNWDLFTPFINSEVRYTSLKKSFPESAELLDARAVEDAKWRHNGYKRLAEAQY